MRRGLILSIMVVCLCANAVLAIDWLNYTGNWNDVAGWVDGRLPTGQEEVKIRGTETVCTLNTSTGDWGVGQRLRVYEGATLLIEQGAELLGAGWMRVGAGSPGTVIQTGGAVILKDGKDKARLGIGDSAGSDGLYIISGGTITHESAGNGDLLIGARGGKGKLVVVGDKPVIAMRTLTVGDQAGASGTLEFQIGPAGVSPVKISNSVTLDPLGDQTTAALMVTAAGSPPTKDIVLVDLAAETAVTGVFDTVNGAAATEGAQVVVTGGGRECTYTLTYAGGTGNDIALLYQSSRQVPLLADQFETAHDYILEELDGYDGLLDPGHILALNASITRPGALYLQTQGASWDPGPGPMLYKLVTGDFVATVKVVDFAGTLVERVFHNDCGILARDPNEANENWVSVNYFPTWTAFVARSTLNGFRDEVGQTAGIWTGTDTFAIAAQYPYIQLERKGSKFYPRISSDGINFVPLTDPPYVGIYNPDDPDQRPLVIDRPDLPQTLQVGLINATYGVTTGYVAFDDLQICVPVQIAVVNASFEDDGKVIEGGVPVGWTANDQGNSGLAMGPSATDGTYFFWQGNGRVLWQTTSEVIAAEGLTYLLQVDVRNSWQGSPQIGLYYLDGETRVLLGTASLPAVGDTWPGPVTLELEVKTTAESVGKRLGVELSLANYPGNYWAEFDNVRLSLR
ncbi:MAG: hypothetical protein QHH07_07080 [Sedimentisphaerales bacterium]|nr:hypothetical protein [Sedimentisphaerales bacterium]